MPAGVFPWPGDTHFGIEYFGGDIWYCLNAGLAGFSITSCDLGGFSCSEQYRSDTYSVDTDIAFDVENICRRVCQSIMFIPVPRIHNNECSIPKLPWNCPESTRELYRESLLWRYEMTPYIYSYAILASKTGEPIIRPMVYHHMDDENVYGINDQLYLGESIIMAPVVQKGALEREVYLPEGSWINMWSGAEYEGRQRIMVEAPLYEISGLPAFIKKGAVIVK